MMMPEAENVCAALNVRTTIGSISDWAILAVVGVVLFFGAKKIPELARSLGSARREFDQGREGEDKTA